MPLLTANTAPPDGTPALVLSNYPYGAPTGPRGPKLSRATPREHLSYEQLKSILNAEAFAVSQGTELAIHVSMHWTADPAFKAVAKAGDGKALGALWSARTTRFFDKLSRWLVRQGIPVAYAWAHEVGKRHGEHTHVMLHVPHPRRIKAPMTYGQLLKDLEAFIRSTENLEDHVGYRGKAVKITGGSFGMRVQKMRSGEMQYWAKSMNPAETMQTGFGKEARMAYLGIDPERNAAPILNKRCGVSASIGPKARRAAGWSELTSIDEIHGRLHPV